MAGLPETYEFGDVRVEAASELVLQSGAPVPLEPKAFELLVYFIQHRGRLLDKQEILDAVWGETFVSENALTRVVAQLRKALGDDAHEPKYIETVPRRGYRFVVDVRTVTTEAEPPAHRWKKVPILVGAALAILFGVGAIVMLYGPEGEDASWPDRPVQVTTSEALDIFPSISPDGNALAFSSNRGGSFEIYVKQLTPAGELIQLTSDGAQNFQPAWSPEGDLIAYYSKTRGGIWTVPAYGGSPRKLTEFGSRPAWSPDGQWIVFQSAPLKDLHSNVFTLPPSTLWICARKDGSLRQLTKDGDPPGGHGNPTWSPHGDRIAFVATELSFFSRFWSVSLEGEPEPLPNLPSGRPYDVLYAPSGNELYITGDGGPFYALWRLDLLGKATEPRVVRADAWPVMRYPSFSADGKKLVYAGVRTWSNLASVSLSTDTYEPAGPPRQLTHYTNERNYLPSFSPDGRTVAFERYFETASDVWLIDPDGANARRLTTHPNEEVRPGWSQDGKRVFFGAYREKYGAGLWSIDVESGEENFVYPHVPHRSWQQLSPDETKIAFHSKKGGEIIDVWVASVDNGVERQLTFDEEMMGFPFWSPDGRFIALQINRGSDTHIGVVPSGGGTPEQLTSVPGLNFGGAWSPDGDKIAFVSWRDDVWNLYWISRTDKRERQLTDYTSLNTFVRYQTWSPLGDQIVYEYAETTGDIWMLELP